MATNNASPKASKESVAESVSALPPLPLKATRGSVPGASASFARRGSRWVDPSALPTVLATAPSNSNPGSPDASAVPSRAASFANSSFVNSSFVGNSSFTSPGTPTVDQLARLTPQQQKIVMMAQRRQSVAIALAGMDPNSLNRLPNSRRTSGITPSSGALERVLSADRGAGGVRECVYSGERGEGGLLERVFSGERGEPMGPALSHMSGQRESRGDKPDSGSRRASSADPHDSSQRRASTGIGGLLERVFSGERGSLKGGPPGGTPLTGGIPEDRLLESESVQSDASPLIDDSKSRSVERIEQAGAVPQETVRRMSFLAGAEDGDDLVALVEDSNEPLHPQSHSRSRGSKGSGSASRPHSAADSRSSSAAKRKRTNKVYPVDETQDADPDNVVLLSHTTATDRGDGAAERKTGLRASLPALASQISRSVQQLVSDAADAINEAAEAVAPAFGIGGSNADLARSLAGPGGRTSFSHKRLAAQPRRSYIFMHILSVFTVALLGFLIADATAMLVTERESVTERWALSVLILHVGTLAVFLLAFVYANEAGDATNLRRSVAFGVANMALFVVRIGINVGYVGFRPT